MADFVRRDVRARAVIRGGFVAWICVQLLGACDGDIHRIRAEAQVIGQYAASRWTIQSGARTTDLLQHGARLTIELRADGTTAGEFYIPPNTAPEPQEDRRSMAGSWRIADGAVQFDQPDDTYVRFTPWSIGPGELRSTIRNGPHTILTVLKKL